MEIPPHPAITAFCRIIGELPEKTRSTAVGFTCNALGEHAQPTGITFSPDRPIRHLYWDHEVDGLFSRLVYLVETVRLKEQLVVQGAMSYIETHFAQWADQDFANASADGFRRTIENVNHELTLPVEKREGKQSNEELSDFITKLENLIATADERRQDAEETRDQLHERFESTFSFQFWEALNMFELKQSRPDIDDLLRGDE